MPASEIQDKTQGELFNFHMSTFIYLFICWSDKNNYVKINMQFISQDHQRISLYKIWIILHACICSLVKVKDYCMLKFKAIYQGQGQIDQNVYWSASPTKVHLYQLHKILSTWFLGDLVFFWEGSIKEWVLIIHVRAILAGTVMFTETVGWLIYMYIVYT